jgi:hypothetical protein
MLSTGWPLIAWNRRARRVELADVDGIAGTGEAGLSASRRRTCRAARNLRRAFDQVVGVFGGADQAQAQGAGSTGQRA